MAVWYLRWFSGLGAVVFPCSHLWMVRGVTPISCAASMTVSPMVLRSLRRSSGEGSWLSGSFSIRLLYLAGLLLLVVLVGEDHFLCYWVDGVSGGLEDGEVFVPGVCVPGAEHPVGLDVGVGVFP